MAPRSHPKTWGVKKKKELAFKDLSSILVLTYIDCVMLGKSQPLSGPLAPLLPLERKAVKIE